MDAPIAAAYLTVEQVAELLAVSAKSVRRWAEADATMPVLRIGGTVRFPRERLERWLHSREQGRARVRRPPSNQVHPPAQVPATSAHAPA